MLLSSLLSPPLRTTVRGKRGPRPTPATVIPAQAGTQVSFGSGGVSSYAGVAAIFVAAPLRALRVDWVPAFAGMTKVGRIYFQVSLVREVHGAKREYARLEFTLDNRA